MADALKRTLRARVRLIRDGVDIYDQNFYEPNETYVESTHQRIVLATNMASPSEIDMSGVASDIAGGDTAETLFLQTDRDVLVALDDNTFLWVVKENGALMLVGSFTHLYVQNESTTNLATIELVITD